MTASVQVKVVKVKTITLELTQEELNSLRCSVSRDHESNLARAKDGWAKKEEPKVRALYEALCRASSANAAS